MRSKTLPSWLVSACLAMLLVLLGPATAPMAQERLLDLFKRVEQLNKSSNKIEAVRAARRLQAAAEKSPGLDRLARANIYGLVGQVFHNGGQVDDGVRMFKREVDDLEKAPDVQLAYLASRHDNLKNILFFQLRRFKDAEGPARRSIEIKKALAKGRATDDLANSLHTLASILRELDRREDAVSPAREAVTMWERVHGRQSGAAANGSNTLAIILQELGRPSEAEAPARRSLEIRIAEAQGRDTGEVALATFTLANLLNAQNKKTEAAVEARKAWEIWDRLHEDGAAANAANTLAAMLMDLGRSGDAEFYAQKAIAFYSKDPNPDNEALVNVRNTLVAVLLAQNRAQAALPIARQVVESRRRIRGPDNGETGNALNSLVDSLTRLGMLDEAEAAAREVVRIWDKTAGPRSNAAANARNTLASALQVRGKLADALDVAKQSLDIWQVLEPTEGGGTAFGSWRVAAIHMAMGNHKEAEPLFEKALKLWSTLHGDGYRLTSLARSGLMSVRFARSDWPGVLAECDSLVKAAVERSGYGSAALGGALFSEFVSDIEGTSIDIHRCVKAAFRIAAAQPASAAGIGARAYEMAQWATGSRAASAVAQMTARMAKGDGPLADALRERQRLIGVWQVLNARLYETFMAGASAPDRALDQEIRKQMGEVQRQKNAIDAEVETRFPDYASVSTVQPVGLRQLQSAGAARAPALIGDEEALVYLLSTSGEKPTPEETFVWIITKTGMRWVRADLGTKSLTDKVAALRCGLDEEEWVAASKARRCATLLGLPEEQIDRSRPLPFHLEIAHELYEGLFGQVKEMIERKRLLIVPSGPLTSLPFHVLVTRKPATALPATFEGYRGVAWLGRQNALSVLPAVSSLKALREHAAKGRRAPLDYIGFGNPVLTGDDPACRSSKTLQSACPSFDVAGAKPQQQQMVASDGSVRATIRGRGGRRSADLGGMFAKGASAENVLAQVRTLCPLPDTAYEIRCVSERFKTEAQTIRLDADATEAEIKALSASGALARYRIVHFATHGLLAGDVAIMAKRQGEPALVMTPPKVPKDADDDGLLTASEVGTLTLNADWVVLSACNTAAGDTLGAEALSGLARAFFYAQARALLVSHWPVYSDAAVRLTTRAFAELDRNPAAGRAEALHTAMAELMDNQTQPDNAHPAVWAPFIVVGEGAPQ